MGVRHMTDGGIMAGFSAALSNLAVAQKSSKGVSLYSRWVNRPIGRVLAAAAHVLGVGPNAVTAVSALVTGSGLLVLVLAPPSMITGLLVAALLVLGFALDSADGQVARLSHTSSMAGEWLDHVVDAGKMVLVHTAVLIAAWRFWDGSARWLLVPLAYQVVSVVMFSGLTLVDLLERTRSGSKSAKGNPSTIRALALLPADYGILALSFVLWGFGPAFRVCYLLLAAVNLLILVAMLVRWFRKLSASE